MIIKKYNITLRNVEEYDAEFILELRTNKAKSRFISATDVDVISQRQWIKNYKSREKNNEEFYFIATDENDIKFATYRAYNLDENQCEIGSWISKPNYLNAINSIKVDIIMKEFAFETLCFEKVNFEVKKENFSVQKYHKLFEPSIIKETFDNIFFVLEKQNFYKNRNRIFKNIK